MSSKRPDHGTASPLVLGGDFSAPSRADWEREVLKVLNRKRPEGKEFSIEQAMQRLRTTTVDGITIEPLYTEGPERLGHPGAAPFTRGSAPRSGSMDAWQVCQLVSDPDAGLSNRAVLSDLERGGSAVWLRVGPDAVASADLAKVLAGVRCDIAGVNVFSRDDSEAAASALAEVWRAGAGPEALGNLGVDPLAIAAVNGRAPDFAALGRWVQVAAAEFPKAKALTVDVLPYHDAGAGDVQELAYAISTGIVYLRELEAAGISPDVTFGQLDFVVSATADQFLTIARLRALRRMWARVGEMSGVPAARRGASQHAVTSWRMSTRDDPWVNLLRGTIATFAAAAGGAEAITTLPFDIAQGLPSDLSRRLARNTQLLAAEESNVGRVSDPAGGSYYVESLTDQLAQKAWQLVQQIEAAGGMAAALGSGLIASQIAETNAARAKLLATRKAPITGVSMFPLADESPLGVRPYPKAPARGGLQPLRDSAVFEALRDRSMKAPAKPLVFLACLGARRDFGGREQFTANLLAVGGLAFPEAEGGGPEEIAAQAKASGAKLAILCSSAKVYATQAMEVARGLKAAGVTTVFIAGRKTEVEDPGVDDVIDGEVYDGMDVVAFLNSALDRLGVAK